MADITTMLGQANPMMDAIMRLAQILGKAPPPQGDQRLGTLFPPTSQQEADYQAAQGSDLSQALQPPPDAEQPKEPQAPPAATPNISTAPVPAETGQFGISPQGVYTNIGPVSPVTQLPGQEGARQRYMAGVVKRGSPEDLRLGEQARAMRQYFPEVVQQQDITQLPGGLGPLLPVLQMFAKTPGGIPQPLLQLMAQKLGIAYTDPKIQALKDQLAARGAEKQAERAATPVDESKAIYINRKTGQPPPPNMKLGDIEKAGSEYQKLNTKQYELFQNLNTLKAHTDLAEQYLGEFPKSSPYGRGWNGFKMWLRTQTNDPQAVALTQQLDELTPAALVRLFSSRGGPTFSKMVKDASLTGAEDVSTARVKLKNLRRLSAEIARYNGIPSELFTGGEGDTSAPSVAPASGQRPYYDANGNLIKR